MVGPGGGFAAAGGGTAGFVPIGAVGALEGVAAAVEVAGGCVVTATGAGADAVGTEAGAARAGAVVVGTGALVGVAWVTGSWVATEDGPADDG